MVQKFTLLLFISLFAFAMTNGQDTSATVGKDSTKIKKSRNIAAIPIVNYNRTQGIVIGAMVSKYYKINKKDTISPSSFTGFTGIYTDQKSYALIAYSKLYFAEDRWRIIAAGGTMDINFQFYLEDQTASAGNFYEYATKANFAVLQIQRNIFNRIYFGPTGTFNKSTTTFEANDEIVQDSVTTSTINNIGYIITNDTRDHVQYPTRGMFLTFKNQFYRDWVGSDYKFVKYNITYNQFFKISKNDDKRIVAMRVSLNIADGDVPFEGQSVVGSDDIRGYSQGKYRNDQVYAIQGEYRWNFYRRWGMVAFAGVASATDQFSHIPDNDILPGVGAGIRFRMLQNEKINIGIDAGVGKEDYSITFRLGESFGR